MLRICMFEADYYPRYSKRAKDLLAAYDIQPPPKIVEVDLRGELSPTSLIQVCKSL